MNKLRAWATHAHWHGRAGGRAAQRPVLDRGASDIDVQLCLRRCTHCHVVTLLNWLLAGSLALVSLIRTRAGRLSNCRLPHISL